MADTGRWGAVLSLVTLRQMRAALRRPFARMLATTLAIVYAFVSMFLGTMLQFTHIPGPSVVYILTQGAPAWNYPALLVITPNLILSLAFLPTIFMVIVSVGVGIGGAMAVMIGWDALRQRRSGSVRATATGAAAGSAPAIAGLATLGACCCTGCAGAAGVAVVAAASGSNVATILLNNWYIGLFEVGIVWVGLTAQERSLRLTASYCPIPPPIDRRFVLGSILRIGLLVAGITWSLAMFVEWGDTPPLTATGPIWYHWIFEHQLLSVFAIAVGLFPKEVAGAFRAGLREFSGRVVRVLLAIPAVTWGVWVPASLMGLGLGGFLNELFGYLGAPATYGAIPPDSAFGPPLIFHWSFQHLLLAGFAISAAILPVRAFVPLLWTVAGERPVPAPFEGGPGSGSESQPRARAPVPASVPPIAALSDARGRAEVSSVGFGRALRAT